jgi:protein tyrosine/serine phosphatase
MQPKRICRAAIVATLVLCAAAVQPQQRSDQESLPNFYQVNDQLYRGAQPKTGGFEELTRLGIKTVVNLSGKGEGVAAEEAQTRNQGLRYFNFPLKRSGRPRDADIERILSIINTPQYQPVFVHCKEGVDRTGTVIAVYRIAHDGWTSQAARTEAERYGMHAWAAAMKNYIDDFYLNHTKQKQVSPGFAQKVLGLSPR